MQEIGNFSTKEQAVKLKNSIVEWLRKNYKTEQKYRFTLGLSGGSDSCSILSLVTEALGNESVFTVSIPYKHNSEGTKSDAQKLCDNLGVKLHWANDIVYDGLNAYKKQLESLGIPMEDNSLAYENMQARLRGVLLMQISAVLNDKKIYNWVLNTGNATEDLFGYYTIQGGDSVGAFSPIGLLTKDEVFALCSIMPEIPESVYTRKATAELNDMQTDEASMGIDFKSSSDILRKIIANPHMVEDWIISSGKNLSKDEKTVLNILIKNSFKLPNYNPVVCVNKNSELYNLLENRRKNIGILKDILANIKK